MSPQVHVKHALKITCSCKSSETPGPLREPSIQSDLLDSTLFQSFSIVIQPHQCPWGCCGNTAKIPVMSLVCATTQQWRISKRWYTCCQTDAKCLHLITGSRCWFVWSHFPSLPDFKNGGLEFCEGLALMTHRVTPLTICCMLSVDMQSHFRTIQNPNGAGTRYYHLMGNPENRAEQILVEKVCALKIRGRSSLNNLKSNCKN